MKVEYALSIKQPWAALVVHGIKSIEIRRWSTTLRGRIFIHASQISDNRKEGWKLVTPEIQKMARLRGGIIGEAELIDCIEYVDLERFQADQHLHLNEPRWFQPPCLYGFHFSQMKKMPFRRLPGSVRFFSVPAESLANA